ncbi:hypothetical protein GQ54DRAFT_275434 [Martensiomyces pterosporus]|nr:hypothetical protein GQ54DRAFT_275434 [Martensiomyces pterosporus]
MVKLSFSLGLLAASIASVSAFTKDQQAGVKTFTPILKAPTSFNTYAEPLSFSTSNTPAPASFVGPASTDNTVKDKTKVAIEYLGKNHNIPAENIKITDAYTDSRNGVTFVYARQVVAGIEISNGLANVNIDREGRVISSSQSFASTDSLAKVKRSAGAFAKRADNASSVKTALKSLADYVKTNIDDKSLEKTTVTSASSFAGGESSYTISNIPQSAAVEGTSTAKKSYIQIADGSLVPVWHIVLQQENHWWSGHVNTDTGKVESINDWVSHSESYNVYPRNVDTPADGSRKVVANPANTKASPKGWVTKGSTYGNNVWAQNNPTGGDTWQNNHRPKAAAGNVFNYPLDLTKDPSAYVDAAITQLFYTVNIMHDLSFLYGFDEAAGNFQDVNYSGRGKGGDGVIANVQDGSGTDNANFATPPDGQRGQMRMYVWTQTNPKRDGDFEQDIVAHEFTHGISNRLTGGPSNTDCLNDGEPGGMGEGWSDTVANLLRITPNMTRKTDIIMGQYAYGKSIRNYPYSTSLTTNPETYSYLDRSDYQEVHSIGEVWATILYEVIWNLNDANGIAADLFSHDLTKGNSIALQIILDGMKLQPCNPMFIDARDAIIQAEKNLTGGKNKCAVWKGFAKRGLGPKASGGNGTNHVEDYSVPSGC